MMKRSQPPQRCGAINVLVPVDRTLQTYMYTRSKACTGLSAEWLMSYEGRTRYQVLCPRIDQCRDRSIDLARLEGPPLLVVLTCTKLEDILTWMVVINDQWCILYEDMNKFTLSREARRTSVQMHGWLDS